MLKDGVHKPVAIKILRGLYYTEVHYVNQMMMDRGCFLEQVRNLEISNIGDHYVHFNYQTMEGAHVWIEHYGDFTVRWAPIT